MTHDPQGLKRLLWGWFLNWSKPWLVNLNSHDIYYRSSDSVPLDIFSNKISALIVHVSALYIVWCSYFIMTPYITETDLHAGVKLLILEWKFCVACDVTSWRNAIQGLFTNICLKTLRLWTVCTIPTCKWIPIILIISVKASSWMFSLFTIPHVNIYIKIYAAQNEQWKMGV